MNLTINNTVNNIIFNGYDVQKLIYNGVTVWSKTAHDYTQDYFTIEPLEAGTITLIHDSTTSSVYYSINDGTWVEYTPVASTTTITIDNLTAGDKVRLAGPWHRGTGSINPNMRFKVYGNIRSIIVGNTSSPIPAGSSRNGVSLQYLFRNNTNIIDAENLVISDFANGVSGMYGSVFYGCTNLEKAPKVVCTDDLKMLSRECQYMFQNCTSLRNIEMGLLPSTNLGTSCYGDMFKGCTNLLNACDVPATTIAASGCKSMFDSCSSLTTAPSILPATTLNGTCYRNMFYNCINLENAPILPNPSNITNSSTFYQQMFYNCSKINYIKCLGSVIGTNLCTNWTYGFGSTGTFVKKAGVTWRSGTNGIPNGWTVIEE